MSAPDRDGPVSGRVHAADPGRPGERLAEAEEWLRGFARCWPESEPRNSSVAAKAADLLAEYDRRGAIVQAAEALVERYDSALYRGAGRDGRVLLDALAAAVRAPDRGADDDDD